MGGSIYTYTYIHIDIFIHFLIQSLFICLYFHTEHTRRLYHGPQLKDFFCIPNGALPCAARLKCDFFRENHEYGLVISNHAMCVYLYVYIYTYIHTYIHINV